MSLARESKLFEDLALSVLAVNKFSLEKLYAMQDRLRHQGVFDFRDMATREVGYVISRLVNAGYDRGETMNNILADRIMSISKFAANGGIKNILGLLEQGRLEQTEHVLLEQNGVGPAVIRNFQLLRDEYDKVTTS